MNTQHSWMRRGTVVGASIATALAMVGPVAAAAPSDPPAHQISQVVHYADLDLNTVAGAKRLAFRIRVAANELCGQIYLRGSDDLAPCHKAVIARAVSGLDAPLVIEALGLAPTRSDFAKR